MMGEVMEGIKTRGILLRIAERLLASSLSSIKLKLSAFLKLC